MKLWGGRFEKPVNEIAEEFGASIPFDQKLYREDIAGSKAHARMLAKQGIISSEDADKIVAGLERIQQRIEKGEFDFRLDREDIHLNIEAELAADIGEAAGRLHTGRSRNDQIALDFRLYVCRVIGQTVERIMRLQETLVRLAEKYEGVIMPGYTHLQRAQPVLLSHHLLAYFEMFQRDAGRFSDCYGRTDVSPLGSGALAGVPYPLDREYVAEQLGLSAVTRNSMDAVSDRDFVVEFLAAAALCSVHLSRFAEEIILWSTGEFGFIELDDSYSTGSSIMPQKKNPDMAELVRGKTGRMVGHLTAILVTLKGLPLSYNKDMQEDKEGLFDASDTLLTSLTVFEGMIATMRIKRENMLKGADGSFATATDLADYLVGKGLPFRQAHEVVGKLVRYAIDNKKTFSGLTLEEFKQFSPLFEVDALRITPETSMSARNTYGGTAPGQVKNAIASSKTLLDDTRQWLSGIGVPV
ncbi:MAG: argininosuccinate lyase [Chloroflexi bacterium]|nr:argininosuccinate lyase [Chloroflexota bacterium]OJW06525.1 MAG: argininosuccinate lyase [Chloroflexi bacterium 54-19]